MSGTYITSVITKNRYNMRLPYFLSRALTVHFALEICLLCLKRCCHCLRCSLCSYVCFVTVHRHYRCSLLSLLFVVLSHFSIVCTLRGLFHCRHWTLSSLKAYDSTTQRLVFFKFYILLRLVSWLLCSHARPSPNCYSWNFTKKC